MFIAARSNCFATLLLIASWACQPLDAAEVRSFHFKEPRPAAYTVQQPSGTTSALRAASTAPPWLRALPSNGSTNAIEFGNRIVLQVNTTADVQAVLQGHALQLARQLADRLFILQAADTWTALTEADALAKDPRVSAAYPIARRAKQRLGSYAPRPNDPFFFAPGQSADTWQANLENRDTNGVRLGLDLNVREAWATTAGKGVLVAIADDGVELNHPDLVARTASGPHFDFFNYNTNGMPSGTTSSHATAVAGLIAATRNNKQGIAGVAPEASLASWVIFGPNDQVVSEEVLMDMFQYQSNVVSVQNHSWGKVGNDQIPLSALEDLAISNAVHFGRAGRGVVMVRAAGNGREVGNDANEDGYVADPRVIGVAAVRLDGRAARYSNPGACILVAAPSGDVSSALDLCLEDSGNIVSTDRQGALGYDQNSSQDDPGNYAFGDAGFSGTSAATPQITGVAALILSVNANLTYRDVQQILLHSASPRDYPDPTLRTNGAGFRVSHNIGFGIPDAGMAVGLARIWPNRPAAATLTYSATNRASIPDLGLRLLVQGTDIPDNLRSIAAVPGTGFLPEDKLELLPLVDVGLATTNIAADLRGKAALIQRGQNFFCQKIDFAARAGAELAVVYNNRDGDVRITMAETDYSSIPSLFISQNDGQALHDYLAAQPDARAQTQLLSTNYTFHVPDTLSCEFVGVRLSSNHRARGDLQIILTSPSGTRSILQQVNLDTLPGPTDWTYYSVQHFYESSYGTWTLQVSDEDDKGTGSITSAQLIITGVRITDTDHDGLDDAWELRYFHTLEYGPADDPDGDGYSNAREQIMGTDPTAVDVPFVADLSVWDSRLARLCWPSNTNTLYRIQFGSESVAPVSVATNIVGQFRQTEWFFPYTDLDHQFFQIEALPKSN